ncbi:MAG: acyltransferase family protein [Adhaeribacter sp.]
METLPATRMAPAPSLASTPEAPAVTVRPEPGSPSPENGQEGSGRLLSIDALRGFDMLLITGGGTLLVLLENKTGWPWVDALARQFEHPPWHGFTFYDFIFPLFLFVAGVSLPFSLNKGLAGGSSKQDLYRKAFWRLVILVLLGMLDKNAPFPVFDPAQIRLGSVLGRIGLAGFVTTWLCLNFSHRGRLALVSFILLGYYAALFLVPVPGYGAGDLSFEGNLVGWIDRSVLPGRLLQQTYDELGLLTQLPALCLTVLGATAGDVLRSRWPGLRKLGVLAGAGAACIAFALVWDLHFPINKHLWSSSFILLTAGMAFVFLAFFYLVIDVLHFRSWAFFFRVIGMNAITVYLAYRFFDFGHTSRLLFGGLYAPAPEPWHEVFQALGALVLVWLFLYFLYRHKLFWKI